MSCCQYCNNHKDSDKLSYQKYPCIYGKSNFSSKMAIFIWSTNFNCLVFWCFKTFQTVVLFYKCCFFNGFVFFYCIKVGHIELTWCKGDTRPQSDKISAHKSSGNSWYCCNFLYYRQLHAWLIRISYSIPFATVVVGLPARFRTGWTPSHFWTELFFK